MKKIIAACIMAVLLLTPQGQVVNAKSIKNCDFEDGIEVGKNSYIITDKKNYKVCFSYTEQKKGTLKIPEYVTYKGKTYTVTAIGRYESPEEPYISVLGNQKITKVIIPKTISKLYPYAFSDCTMLKSIEFRGNKIKTISDACFNGSYKIKTIKIPEGVKTINAFAFSSCYGMTSITLPKSLAKIEGVMLSECTKLKKIKIAKGNKKFKVYKGLLVSKNGKTVYGSVIRKGYYKIPDKVERITSYVFNRHKITTLKLGKNTKYIENNAFAENLKLEKIVWNKKIKKIDEGGLYTFKSGTGEKTLPKSIRELGDDAIRPGKYCVLNEGLEKCDGLSLEDTETLVVPASLKIFNGGFFFDKEDAVVEFKGKIPPKSENKKQQWCIYGPEDKFVTVIVPKGSLNAYKSILDQEEWCKTHITYQEK